jgi:phosphoenolpyruvate carboxykinase (GTP)
MDAWTSHSRLQAWISTQIALCKPSKVHFCTGSTEEYETLMSEMVESGVMIPLHKEKYPNCYLARSAKEDVARVENRTYICSEKREDAGPTNNWEDPIIMKNTMVMLFDGCMRGRTMYVIPFSMGPVGSSFSAIGVQITDSAYAVVNMRTMTRMGISVLHVLGTDGEFVPCMHTVGMPLVNGHADVPWPQNNTKYICHFPETKEIWSFGSGYGGNALLGKKCYALRIASVMGHNNNWLAEHMLLMGVTHPDGIKKYFAAAFPSACGKTNFSMLVPSLPGWKVEILGDDIAWIRVGADGRLYAMNPEAGYFGVAPGTSAKTNPVALATIQKNTIFTNVAVDADGCPWWEGLTKTPPPNLTSWLNKPWDGTSPKDGPAAHPNSRFTTPAHQCPIIDPLWDHHDGVPLSGIIFGGRRSDTIPLVYQSFDWNHGVYMGATMTSETTAAAEGARGVVRYDPFAMLPFCGYNMGDYFQHWINIGAKATKAPPIFYVNWFRKDEQSDFMWPGFGENIRVMEWIFGRCMGTVDAVQTPIGLLPVPSQLNLSGLSISEQTRDKLLDVPKQAWIEELERHGEFLKKFGDAIPTELLMIHRDIARCLATRW